MSHQYRALLERIITSGVTSPNRTGDDTLSVFGAQQRHDLERTVPALTLKRVFTKGVKREFLWMVAGDTNTTYLTRNGVGIWDQWAVAPEHVLQYNAEHPDADLHVEAMTDQDRAMYGIERPHALAVPDLKVTEPDGQGGRRVKLYIGDLGPVYGAMMRAFPGHDGKPVDQITILEHNLKENPMSRRHIVSMWCPSLLPDESMSPQFNVIEGRMALAPCHWNFQVKVEQLEEVDPQSTLRPYRLNLHYHMRSNDVPVGKPMNDLYYAYMAHTLAQQADMYLGELWCTQTDSHIYKKQLPDLTELMERDVLPEPSIQLTRRPDNLYGYRFEDLELIDYVAHDAIPMKVSV